MGNGFSSCVDGRGPTRKSACKWQEIGNGDVILLPVSNSWMIGTTGGTTGLTWEAYVTRYTKEMESQQEAIAALAEEARHATITLLCQEEEGDPHCHRHLLKKMIEDAMKA